MFGFPCNQFFRQSQDKDFETLALLKHVRPGEGYEPKFAHSTKIDVNGANEHAIFTWLKDALPTPVGPGSEEVMGDHTRIAWDPVKRSDITWNFEKFLVNQNGVPVKRYSKSFETKDIAADIQKLIDGGADALSA